MSKPNNYLKQHNLNIEYYEKVITNELRYFRDIFLL